MSDEIIREVWQIKDAIGKEVNYDLRSLGAELQKRQNYRAKQVVDLSLQRKRVVENLSAAHGRTSQLT